MNNANRKNKFIAALLAFFLGGIGIHKFYLGRVGWGITYLLFSWTGIPMFMSILESIVYIFTPYEDFDRKYH